MRKERIDLGRIMRDNAVTILFVLMCIICMIFSGQSVSYVMFELFSRLMRNAFIILALIIPIIAGMGINFAITIGAMASQIAMLWVLEWQIPGILGFLTAAAITVPIATLFGFLVGKLLNKMKGQEMIGSMILGYFANGLYQLVFLFIFGNLIPLNTPGLVIKGSTGVANTMDLSKATGIKYSLDGILRLPFATALYIFMACVVVYALVTYFRSKDRPQQQGKTFALIGVALISVIAIQIPAIRNVFTMVQIPVVTACVVGLLCLFNIAIMRTRLGQQFRAVGQNATVANAAGINVNRTRIIAIIFSTVLAGWGQIIFVQNMGSFQTYGAHEQVGLYAGAAILVGGASIVRATNTQALLGCVLFHTLFVVAPAAGNNLFGDAVIGEHFRVFISYGVIALALVLHAWRGHESKKPRAVMEQAAKSVEQG